MAAKCSEDTKQGSDLAVSLRLNLYVVALLPTQPVLWKPPPTSLLWLSSRAL